MRQGEVHPGQQRRGRRHEQHAGLQDQQGVLHRGIGQAIQPGRLAGRGQAVGHLQDPSGGQQNSSILGAEHRLLQLLGGLLVLRRPRLSSR